ncbi:MAG: FFLEELY motif protein [Anaerolineales bacterium]|jgi:hypothetical protein
MTTINKLRQMVGFTRSLESPDEIQEQALQIDRKDHLDVLRTWQSQRLATTYADLLANPRYARACRFFLEDVYAAKDFRQRDEEIRHLYEIISRFLPDILLKLVKTVIELNDLTQTLDEELWTVMQDQLGVTDTITMDLYMEGYRLCDNYAERAYQIKLIDEIGHMVDLTTRIPMIGTTLKLVRAPVTAAGWGDLHDWIQRGFLAFKHMHGAKEFLAIIHEREMAILDAAIPDHS